jgi:hypothetical protein
MNKKDKIMNMLKKEFGSSIHEVLKNYYEDENIEELKDLANQLLVKKLGEEKSKGILDNILKD